MSPKIAPRNGPEARAFLLRQHQIGATNWRGLCLSLQRQARGLPAVYPSAISAAMATPESERVHKVRDLRAGMVAYSDDPNDSNRYGHIYFIIGWKNPKNRSDASTCLTWTNDRRPGRVDVVPLTFFKNSWGDGFQFGATWLNGYDFSDFNAKPKTDRGPQLGNAYDHAIEDLRKVIRRHRSKGHDRLVKLLERDLQRMLNRRKRFS